MAGQCFVICQLCRLSQLSPFAGSPVGPFAGYWINELKDFSKHATCNPQLATRILQLFSIFFSRFGIGFVQFVHGGLGTIGAVT